MPTIDAKDGLLVIRIVYDGPPLSGKTTSMRALAESVQSQLDCPEERAGRTLYFDWLEYVGGVFEGRQIRCQVVSVPGQRDLAARRRFLVESADAVVCVLDTRRSELEFGLSWLRELAPLCRAEPPPVGIVVQANKRDAPDAVQRDELRARVQAIAPIAVVDSVATAADGIREAFVLSVRLALDRVRALSQEGRLGQGVPCEASPSELLAALLRADEQASTESESHVVLAPNDPRELGLAPQAEEPAPRPSEGEPSERVFVPDPLMPGGMIWPPVDGRALLYEVSSLALRPARTERGDWWGSGAGWRCHSSPRALFHDPDRARAELIAWARLHASHASLLSGGRAVVLADAGVQRLRLWQLVRVEATLRERLDAALSEVQPARVAEGVLEVAWLLLRAAEAFAQASVPLPCTLWTVGTTSTEAPCFVGLMPTAQASNTERLEPVNLCERELAPHLRALRRNRVDYQEVLRELQTPPWQTSLQPAADQLAAIARTVD
jgi:signal recognition particle receptor subunit beta